MNELTKLRRDVYQNLERQRRLKEVAYKNFNKVLDKNQTEPIYISWEQLKTVQVGDTVKMSNDGDVEFIKLSENENEMIFNTMMFDGGKFTKHFHDCVEICKVLSGRMIETEKGDRLTTKVYSEGERAIYDKGETHAMYVNEYTLLEVRFLKQL